MGAGEGGIGSVARLGAIALCFLVANCAQFRKVAYTESKYRVAASPRVVGPGDRVPKGGGVYRVGTPYSIAERDYVPEANPRYSREGVASWYGRNFHGRLTANGEVFDMRAISAAHPTLPLPSYARVTNLANKRSMVVRVNDRGPFARNRVIDLSHKAAHVLGFADRGLARVRVEYVGPAGLEGSDDRKLMATLREGEPAPVSAIMASASPAISQSAKTEPLAPPVSAAAPVRYDARAAVISGHGLY